MTALEIAGQIEAMIGELQPGDQIPTIKEMMRVFGVTTHPVEKAVYYLLGKGLVEIRDWNGGYMGVFVVRKT